VRRTQVVLAQKRLAPNRTVLVLFTATALALAIGCKRKEQAPRPEVAGPSPPVSTGTTTETMAAMRFFAEVPKYLAQRVVNDAAAAFAPLKDTQTRWPTLQDKALDYYHSTELLASLARAEGLTSSPIITETVEDILYDEYSTRLFWRQAGEIPVTDKEIEDYYKSHLSQYVVKGQFWVRHIFLNVVDNPGKEKEKEALAQKALVELNAGKPFQQVAEKYSEAEGKKGEILIPPLAYGEINPDLEKAIVALQPGQHTGVIPSKWGYNIFRLEQIERPTTKTLEMMRDSIVRQLRSEKTPAVYRQFLNQLEQQYPMTKNYQVLDDPNATSNTVVVEGSFVKITVGDYRQHVAQMLSPKRAAMSESENRVKVLDSWIAWKRLEHAGNAAGFSRDPELQGIKRYVTDAMLAFACLERLTANLSAPKEEEIRKYYLDHRDYFTSKPAELRLRELVISYRLPDGASKRDYYLARKKTSAKAEEVVAKLKEGADFVSLVRQYSTSGSASKDGDLGFATLDRWGSEIGQRIAHLQVGEYTEPIEDNESFSIFRLEDRKSEILFPLDEPRKQYIREILSRQLRDEVSARIRIKLAGAYRKDLPLEAVRKTAASEVTEAGTKK